MVVDIYKNVVPEEIVNPVVYDSSKLTICIDSYPSGDFLPSSTETIIAATKKKVYNESAKKREEKKNPTDVSAW